LIVCGYKQDQECGIVVSLGLYLSSVNWSVQLKGPIKSTPVYENHQVWVVAGEELAVLNCADGAQILSLELPSRTESRPVTLLRRGSSCFVYAFSEWDSGLAIVDEKGKLTLAFMKEIPSPVYANLLALDSNRLVVCDISGNIHVVNVESMTIKSTKVTNKPLFGSPTRLGESILFGSHDGIVRCVSSSDLQQQWQYDARTVVYASPLVISRDLCIICTTAGDVALVRKGKELWRTKVLGEIWSDPVLFTGEDGVTRIVVGARDSKVHIITINSRSAEESTAP